MERALYQISIIIFIIIIIITKCDLGILESINHLLMQCPFYSNERMNLHKSLNTLGTDLAIRITSDPANYFYTIMGKQPKNTDFQDMVDIWLLTGDHISSLYKGYIRTRID